MRYQRRDPIRQMKTRKDIAPHKYEFEDFGYLGELLRNMGGKITEQHKQARNLNGVRLNPAFRIPGVQNAGIPYAFQSSLRSAAIAGCSAEDANNAGLCL